MSVINETEISESDDKVVSDKANEKSQYPRALKKRPPIPNNRVLSRRKLSLHQTSATAPVGEFATPVSTRRRFSNVSDAVTRKLSNWRNNNLPTEEIITLGKSFCGLYIRNRLKRSGIFNKKLGLTRLPSVIGTQNGATMRDVFRRLNIIGIELERLNPKVHVNIARQAGRAILVNDKTVHILFLSIGKNLVKNGDLTWSKVVSIYAVAGGLAVDCVKQGRPEFISKIIDGMGELLENDLATWIAHNGGWMGLMVHFRPPEPGFTMLAYMGLICAVLIAVLLIAFFLKWFGSNLF